MSEYQYYEFRAVDRPLGERELAALRRITPRAEITPTSLVNTYEYGDFKGDPGKLVAQYFDAFVYVANWGTNRLMLKAPERLLKVKRAKEYEFEEALSVASSKGHLIFDFLSNDESGADWVEGEPWMPSLIGLRDEIIRGDLRPLYLGWLAGLGGYWGLEEDNLDELTEDDREPPVPPGLAQLSTPQKALVEFLRIDNRLLDAAALASIGTPPRAASRTELARWVKSLPAAVKDEALLRVLADQEEALVRGELFKNFEASRSGTRTTAPRKQATRMIRELLDLGKRAGKTSKRTKRTSKR